MLIRVTLTLAWLGSVAVTCSSADCGENRDAANPLTLEELFAGKLQIVDLTYAINEKSIFWPGDNYEPFKLKTIATLERNGVLSKAFCMPEHLGTHIDAPNHFEARRASVDEIPPANLLAKGVLIDITSQAIADPDYQLSVDDIKHWEAKHGPVEPKSVVLLRTGWGRFWSQPARFKNQDVGGRMHFPGYSEQAASLLVAQRDVRGIGIDTMSIDYGLSKDFAVHHVVNKASRYGIENLAQLDRLPPRGFYLIIAPIKIEGGSGGPARVLALLP